MIILLVYILGCIVTYLLTPFLGPYDDAELMPLLLTITWPATLFGFILLWLIFLSLKGVDKLTVFYRSKGWLK